MIKSARKPLRLERKLLTTKQLQLHNFLQGYQGEKRAAAYLVSQGYRVLDTNIRYKTHEIDLVALDTVHQELVFCEVKTRLRSEFGHASHAVNQRKINSMKLVAQLYLEKQQLSLDFRFDLIVVWPNLVEHFQNVTWT